MSAKTKILAVRVGRGGDVVMTTPALDAILAAYPGAEVDVMTSREGRRILGGFDPRMGESWIYRRRFPHGLSFRLNKMSRLRAQEYSHVFVFETNRHYARLLDGVGQQTYVLRDNAGRHYCDQCLDLVSASTSEPVARGWVRLPVTAEGLEAARDVLKRNGVAEGDRVVGLHPTFSGSTSRFSRDSKGTKHRVWPRESFVRLARELVSRPPGGGSPLRVVVDALPEERELIEPLVEESGGAITLLCEPPNFERYKGLLKCMDVFVTPNTGPMHMAAAVGANVVALFSHWSPADCGPFTPPDRHRVLRAEDTPQAQLGLAAIQPSTVAAAVQEFLDPEKS